MQFDRDDNGNVTNPPTDPDFERRIAAAANTGSDDEVAYVQSQYDDWRDQEIRRREGDGSTGLRGSDPTPDEPPAPADEREPATGATVEPGNLAGLSDDDLAAEVERRNAQRTAGTAGTPDGGAA